MKFYYNGKLVRTSKNHEYKYGILSSEGGSVTSCHATYEAAYKELQRRPGEIRTNIEITKEALKELEKGKSY